MLGHSQVQEAINRHGAVSKKYHIANIDRAALSRVSGVLAAKYGDRGFNGALNFQLSGAAGQSFCAFLSHGMNVILSGFANDYVCKGMAGGRVAISPVLNGKGI